MRSKNYFVLALVTFIVLVILLGDKLRCGWWDKKADFRIAVLSNEGVEIVAVSPGRRMVNSLRVKGESQVWIPGGYGWYRADKLKKLLVLENRVHLIDDICRYNFGFVNQKTMVVDNFDDWKAVNKMTASLGLVNTVLLKREIDEDLYQKEELKDVREPRMAELMVRDFSDNRISNEDLKIAVFNTSGLDGLAGWLSDRLEWVGFGVVETNASDEKVEKCQIRTGKKSLETYSMEILQKFMKCEVATEDDLAEKEVDIYVGAGFAEMIKYLSYVGTL